MQRTSSGQCTHNTDTRTCPHCGIGLHNSVLNFMLKVSRQSRAISLSLSLSHTHTHTHPHTRMCTRTPDNITTMKLSSSDCLAALSLTRLWADLPWLACTHARTTSTAARPAQPHAAAARATATNTAAAADLGGGTRRGTGGVLLAREPTYSAGACCEGGPAAAGTGNCLTVARAEDSGISDCGDASDASDADGGGLGPGCRRQHRQHRPHRPPKHCALHSGPVSGSDSGADSSDSSADADALATAWTQGEDSRPLPWAPPRPALVARDPPLKTTARALRRARRLSSVTAVAFRWDISIKDAHELCETVEAAQS